MVQQTDKKQSKPTDSYMSYSKYVREELEKELTEKDHSYIMSQYITGVHVDKCVENMRSKK